MLNIIGKIRKPFGSKCLKESGVMILVRVVVVRSSNNVMERICDLEFTKSLTICEKNEKR